MKKKRALRILSLILLCALTFTACKKNVGTPEDNAASKDENTEEKDKDEQESWKIGFSGIDMENPYFLTLESAIKEEVDGKNCELIVKLSLIHIYRSDVTGSCEGIRGSENCICHCTGNYFCCINSKRCIPDSLLESKEKAEKVEEPWEYVIK